MRPRQTTSRRLLASVALNGEDCSGSSGGSADNEGSNKVGNNEEVPIADYKTNYENQAEEMMVEGEKWRDRVSTG